MLFTGVMLLFNDFHMEFFDSAYELHGNMLAFECGRTSTQTKNTAKSGFCRWEGVPTPEDILQKFSVGQYPVVLRGAENLDRIFFQMYQVPEEIRIPYFKAKVIELLLQLQMLKAPEVAANRDLTAALPWAVWMSER